MKLLTYSEDVHVSLSWTPAILVEVFRGFPHHFQENSRTVFPHHFQFVIRCGEAISSKNVCSCYIIERHYLPDYLKKQEMREIKMRRSIDVAHLFVWKKL
jgi:hypothetical protein